MNCRMGKNLLLLLVLILIPLILPVTVLAASNTQDGLKLELTTDKSEYSGGDTVKVTATVTNTNDFDVKNVNLEVELPHGLMLSTGEKGSLTIANLPAGETQMLLLAATPEKTDPTEETTDPTQEATDPTQEATDPTQEATDPTQETKDSSQETTDPTQGTADSTQTASNSPKTGDNSNIRKWKLVGMIAAAGGLVALALSKKKALSKHISMFLCLALILSIVAPSIPAYANSNRKNFVINETITVDGVSHTIGLKVNYELEDVTTEENQYKLVWEDNFDGTELNMNDWNYEYHEPGWVNNELQEYVDSSDNIFVKDGKLVIKAIKTVDGNNTSYTSGRVNTQNKHDYKYGRFEAKAQVPSGKGFLPAFWMMPTNENLYGQWPKCGEIDIMEVLGSVTNESHGTLHFGEPHTQSQGSYTLKDGDFASEYHVYACEWEPDEIRFYVDGKLFHTENDWFTKKPGNEEVTYPAPYDQPFYMILNLAVGGNWPGNPDETTQFNENAELRVDYVKVYQKESYDENVTKPEKELVFQEPDASGNYVVNGDFSTKESLQDNKNWEFLLQGGAATAEISDNALHIKTTDAGTLDYSIQVVTAGLPMIKGNKYRLSFDASASAPRTMITAITAPDKGYIRYLADTSVSLTTDNQSYSYEFDIMKNSDVNGRLEFNLGNQNSTEQVTISNVRLEIIGTVDLPEEVKDVLPDGNYVYNGEFQQGSDRMQYWSVDNQCGAQVAVTNANNIRELKVSVPNTTSSLNQVVVKQPSIALRDGKKYVLSFDAYADGSKTIQTLVAGNAFDCALTTEKTTYKYTFDTSQEVNGAELQFLLGAAGITYIDNVRIQEDALLINGDFSNGLTGYEMYAYTPGDVYYVVDDLNENGAFCIDISNTGDADWKIQLKQNNITMENGKWYEINLDAKSTLDRTIMYALQRDGSADDDWTPYSGTQKINLTNAYQTFTTKFQMTRATDLATILSISMGAVDGTQITNKHTIAIDNIKLKEIDAPEQEEIAAGTELIKNGNFAEGETGWIKAITSPAEATIEFSDGKALCNIAKVGDADWNVQLKQSGLHLEQGASYEVKFTVKSTSARIVKYALLNRSYDWYGGADINLEENIEKEVADTITIGQDKASDASIDFVFSMGKIAGLETPESAIQISNISIIKK